MGYHQWKQNRTTKQRAGVVIHQHTDDDHEEIDHRQNDNFAISHARDHVDHLVRHIQQDVKPGEDHDHEHHHHDGCGCGHDHDHEGHHHADEVFTSWGKETPHKYSEEEMKQILDTLANEEDAYGAVLRAKGIVPAVDGTWIHFDLTPGEYEIRHGAADVIGRICVIGAKLEEEKLEKLFQL